MSLEFRPNLPKIVELLLYLAHKRANADKYQAVKFFYLADREHLNLYGRPITCELYYALPYGPVASKAKELIEGNRWTMRSAKIKELPFRTERIPRPGPDKEDLIVIREPKRNFDLDLFSKSDLSVFDDILKKYGHLGFDALYNITHDHAAYKRAWAKRGHQKRGLMVYEDMIEARDNRERIISDIGPVSAYL